MIRDLCFEIIERCPNNCLFCSSRSSYDKQNIISFNKFKEVIDYFSSNGGIEELSLSGGEPMLHKDIYKMILYAKQKNIRVVLFTSGLKKMIVNDSALKTIEMERQKDLESVLKSEPDNSFLIESINKHYDSLIKLQLQPFSSISKSDFKLLKEAGLFKIVFDMQAYTSEVDNYLMGRNHMNWCNVLDSIYNASLADILVDIHFVPMRPNVKELPELISLLSLININQINILKFVPQGRGRDNEEQLKLSDEELMQFLNLLYEYIKKWDINVRIGIPLMEENSHKCTAGLQKLDIKFDGTVLPCPAFKEIDAIEAKSLGIKLPNIYDNLEDISILGYGTRNEPLCRKLYQKNKTFY